jgi:hypothetical protein
MFKSFSTGSQKNNTTNFIRKYATFFPVTAPLKIKTKVGHSPSYNVKTRTTDMESNLTRIRLLRNNIKELGRLFLINATNNNINILNQIREQIRFGKTRTELNAKTIKNMKTLLNNKTISTLEFIRELWRLIKTSKMRRNKGSNTSGPPSPRSVLNRQSSINSTNSNRSYFSTNGKFLGFYGT